MHMPGEEACLTCRAQWIFAQIDPTSRVFGSETQDGWNTGGFIVGPRESDLTVFAVPSAHSPYAAPILL